MRLEWKLWGRKANGLKYPGWRVVRIGPLSACLGERSYHRGWEPDRFDRWLVLPTLTRH